MLPKKSYTNELLFANFRDGSQKAFRVLFDQYWETMFRKANSILRNREVAQDVVQEIWINLWHQRTQLEITNFEAYIFRSVRYGCYKYLKNNKFNTTQLQIIDSLSLTRPDIENRHNLEWTEKEINRSLNELSPRCQEIFRLSKMEGATNEEIAFKLGISKRSVENQVSLALKTVRQHLTTLHITSLFLYFFLVF
ncbi:RNA polymerase sigma-70 factor [Sinomicrobium soli]|uniref:RNA polymerase sigma-70 factor n=1 Tax=Sinomicrobium sp. N-1-3-6 TaxID=2219864 RepID=UPI001F031DF6|nr:RNA polymerase sigma-70 factor [Sinomicrobium sp. N-1-3-6]